MSEYKAMWIMLSENQLEIDSNVLELMSCIICHKLLIDAIRGPCECTYCRKCIENHLRNSNGYCPGDGSRCKSEKLTLNGNTKTDPSMNSLISKIKAKCPSESCGYSNKLIDICDHLRLCNKRAIFCPFREIGCNANPILSEKMSDHLLEQIFEHSRLTIDWLINMRNENTAIITNKQRDLVRDDLKRFEESMEQKICQAFNNEEYRAQRNMDGWGKNNKDANRSISGGERPRGSPGSGNFDEWDLWVGGLISELIWKIEMDGGRGRQDAPRMGFDR